MFFILHIMYTVSVYGALLQNVEYDDKMYCIS